MYIASFKMTDYVILLMLLSSKFKLGTTKLYKFNLYHSDIIIGCQCWSKEVLCMQKLTKEWAVFKCFLSCNWLHACSCYQGMSTLACISYYHWMNLILTLRSVLVVLIIDVEVVFSTWYVCPWIHIQYNLWNLHWFWTSWWVCYTDFWLIDCPVALLFLPCVRHNKWSLALAH